MFIMSAENDNSSMLGATVKSELTQQNQITLPQAIYVSLSMK